ncbi:MAG: diadenylate cyclase CdaA [Desulfovibrionaceae bacterium]
MFGIEHLSMDWRDVLDIALVTILLYQVIIMVRGTRALTVILGLGLLMLLYFFAKFVGLYTLTWMLQHVFSSLFLVVVILFQRDIRQALGDMGARSFWRRTALQHDSMTALVNACVEMGRLRVGALIVLERSMPLGDMVGNEGVRLDALISTKLLMNIFYPKAPLHDGAVIISKGRITAAACILPLAVVQGQNFGTRHRAALGITEESDAVVIVVSEERGEISVAMKGKFTRNIDAAKLAQVLTDVL